MSSQSNLAVRGNERSPFQGAHALGAVGKHECSEVTARVKGRNSLPELNNGPEKPMSREELKSDGSSKADIETNSEVFQRLAA